MRISHAICDRFDSDQLVNLQAWHQ